MTTPTVGGLQEEGDDVSEEELLVRGPPPPAIGPLTQVRK